MSLLVSKPVVACSLIASSIILVSYLWLKHRSQEEEEETVPDSSSSTKTKTVPDLDQVNAVFH